MDRSHPLTEATLGKANIELLNDAQVDVVTIGNNEESRSIMMRSINFIKMHGSKLHAVIYLMNKAIFQKTFAHPLLWKDKESLMVSSVLQLNLHLL